MGVQVPKFLPAEPMGFRQAMSHFVTGVAVVTSHGADGPFGMTVNSLTSVSLDPCLLLICLKRASATGGIIRSRGSFVVNILGHEQTDIALRFSRPGQDRFKGIDVHYEEGDLPVLGGCLAHLICDLRTIHDGGDHDIVVGEVRAFIQDDGEPLMFGKGSFGRYLPTPKPTAAA